MFSGGIEKDQKYEMGQVYNHFHNILRLFDVLPNFPFTTSEMMSNYYLQHGIYKLPHKLPNNLRLWILGN